MATYDFESVLQNSMKEANPDINIEEGSPLYDVYVKPFAAVMKELSETADTLESMSDYSKFFNDDGSLKDDSYFDILRHNFFLGDALASRSLAKFIMAFNEPVQSIEVSTDIVLVQSQDTAATRFIIKAGTYTLPLYRKNWSRYEYIIGGVSVDETSSSISISAGTWNVEEGALPVGCISIRTAESTTAGRSGSSSITYTKLLDLVGRKALDSVASILYNINANLSSIGVTPDRIDAVGYEDPEYESGLLLYNSSAGTVEAVMTGGYTDVRLHEGCEKQTFVLKGLQSGTSGMYIKKFDVPVYGIYSVKDFAENDIYFEFDYSTGQLNTVLDNVIIECLTTSSTAWYAAKNTIAQLPAKQGEIILKPYYSVRVFVDTSCLSSSAVNTSIDLFNNTLLELFTAGKVFYSTLSYNSLRDLMAPVFGTDIYNDLIKLKIGYPDGFTEELTGINLTPSHSAYVYTLNGLLRHSISLTANNSIVTGGCRR